MPYLPRHGALPQRRLRPIRPRGMGQTPTTSSANLAALSQQAWYQCPWWDVVCALQTLTTGSSSYQIQNAPLPTPPAPAGPGAPQTAEQMTQPGTYTPMQSAQDQATQTDQNIADFFASIPSYTAAGAPAGGCDWTQAAWLNPLTWCSANWVMAAGALLGGVLLVRQVLR